MPLTEFRKRYYTLSRAEIGYLRFILESYDGLAFARTLDNKTGLVEIAWPEERSPDVEELLTALTEEIGLTEASPPDPVPPL